MTRPTDRNISPHIKLTNVALRVKARSATLSTFIQRSLRIKLLIRGHGLLPDQTLCQIPSNHSRSFESSPPPAKLHPPVMGSYSSFLLMIL